MSTLSLRQICGSVLLLFQRTRGACAFNFLLCSRDERSQRFSQRVNSHDSVGSEVWCVGYNFRHETALSYENTNVHVPTLPVTQAETYNGRIQEVSKCLFAGVLLCDKDVLLSASRQNLLVRCSFIFASHLGRHIHMLRARFRMCVACFPRAVPTGMLCQPSFWFNVGAEDIICTRQQRLSHVLARQLGRSAGPLRDDHRQQYHGI